MTEEVLRREVARLELYKAQLENLARQEELLRFSLEEHLRARETLASYQKCNEGEVILVPIGANSFLFAQIKDRNKAIVGIGSDIAIEDSISSALQRLDGRMNALNEAGKTIAKKMNEVNLKIGEHSKKVQEEYEKLQSGKS